MSAPHPRLCQHLSAPGLVKTMRQSFAKVADPRRDGSLTALSGALMSGLAVFGLQLRRDHPHLKLIVVEDSLAGNGPHLHGLKALNLRYIIGIKEGDHEALFAAVQAKLKAGQCQKLEYTDEHGVEHGYCFVNDLALNKAHPELRVNFSEYWEIDAERQQLFSWITDLELTTQTAEPIMRGGRARWKVENEAFNTLKNQELLINR